MVATPALLAGETMDSLFERVAATMRAAGYPLNIGTPEYLLARAFALQLYDVGAVVSLRLYQSLFIRTASGSDLDQHGEHYSLPRLDATRATATLTFEGTDGTVIPLDTLVTTAAQVGAPAVAFRTAAGGTIGTPDTGTVEIAAVAVEAGAAGIVGAEALRFLANPIAGVSNVFNNEAAVEGSDVETDAAYRARLLERAAEDPGTATIDDYERLIDAIPGVGFRLVEPHWNGYGTIRVVILDEDGGIPSEPLLELVQETLDPLASQGEGEGRASIAHAITVVAPTEVELTLDVPDLVAEAGYSLAQAKANLEAAATAYVRTINPGGSLVIRDLEAVLIQAAGVANLGDITLDAVRADVPLLTTEKAVIASVTYDGA